MMLILSAQWIAASRQQPPAPGADASAPISSTVTPDAPPRPQEKDVMTNDKTISRMRIARPSSPRQSRESRSGRPTSKHSIRRTANPARHANQMKAWPNGDRSFAIEERACDGAGRDGTSTGISVVPSNLQPASASPTRDRAASAARSRHARAMRALGRGFSQAS